MRVLRLRLPVFFHILAFVAQIFFRICVVCVLARLCVAVGACERILYLWNINKLQINKIVMNAFA